jgi:5'(3')-deoxyribonucleotidase
MTKKTIAIDFDGVIHRYSRGWHDGSCYDNAVKGAIKAIIKLINKDYHIVIFSTRADSEERIIGMKSWFASKGLHEEYLSIIEITNKKPNAIAYIDDRGIRFTNWTDMLNYF